MKKYPLEFVLFTLFLSLNVNMLFPQQAYVNINAGYGIGMSTTTAGNYVLSETMTTTHFSTQEAVNVSLGKGFNAGGALGYMLNKHIGFELGIFLLSGGKTKMFTEVTYYTAFYKEDYAMHSNMLGLTPALVLSSGLEKINPFAKFGLVMGTGSVYRESVRNVDGDIFVEKWEDYGGIALGCNAALGASIKIKDIFFFGEIIMVNLSYAPSKGKLTEYTSNGVDLLPDMTVREKEIVFADFVTYDPDKPVDHSQASKELKQKEPYGSLGVNIGLKLSF